MHNYPGQDSPSVPTPTAGTGVYTTPQVADDGDKRSAANLMAAAEALSDRSAWAANRIKAWNPIEGGTSTWTATIATKNTLVFSDGGVTIGGTGEFDLTSVGHVYGGGTLYCGDPAGVFSAGGIVAIRGSSITATGLIGAAGTAYIQAAGANATMLVTNGAQFQLDDNASGRVTGDISFGFGSTTSQVTRYNPEVRSGARAYTVPRIKRLVPSDFTAGNCTITVTDFDVWVLPTGLAGPGPYTLTVASSSVNCKFMVKAADPSIQGADVWIENHVPQLRGKFLAVAAPSTNAGSCQYFYDGTAHDFTPSAAPFDGVGYGNATATFSF